MAHISRVSPNIPLRTMEVAPSISFAMVKTLTASSLSKAASYTCAGTVSANCPTWILDGARGLFASGASLRFVVLLVSGAAADDDAGVAAGFGVRFPVTLDLDLPWGV